MRRIAGARAPRQCWLRLLVSKAYFSGRITIGICVHSIETINQSHCRRLQDVGNGVFSYEVGFRCRDLILLVA